MKDISPTQLNNFYKDLSSILDCTIINVKQREAIDYQILRLMNLYFLFELPEDQE